MRKVTAILGTIMLALGLSFAVAAPAAHASPPPTCFSDRGYMGSGPFTDTDGVQVYYSGRSWLTEVGCNNVYIGETDHCGTFRIVRISPLPRAIGGSFRSCWTYVPGSSGFGGWLKDGYDIIVEQLLTGEPRSNFGIKY